MLLPRRVQIAAGIVLLAWAGLSLTGSIALLRMEPSRNWLLFTLGTASFWEIATGGAFNLIVAAQLLRAVGRADEHDDE